MALSLWLLIPLNHCDFLVNFWSRYPQKWLHGWGGLATCWKLLLTLRLWSHWAMIRHTVLSVFQIELNELHSVLVLYSGVYMIDQCPGITCCKTFSPDPTPDTSVWSLSSTHSCHVNIVNIMQIGLSLNVTRWSRWLQVTWPVLLTWLLKRTGSFFLPFISSKSVVILDTSNKEALMCLFEAQQKSAWSQTDGFFPPLYSHDVHGFVVLFVRVSPSYVPIILSLAQFMPVDFSPLLSSS